MKITSEEKKVLDQIQVQLSNKARYQITLEKLLDNWKRFVREVENGYEDSIYDYTNDLAVRDLLLDITLEVPISLKDRIIELIKPWDVRFNDATVEIEHPLRELEKNKLSLWWLRIPKKLTGELKEDLHSEGII